MRAGPGKPRVMPQRLTWLKGFAILCQAIDVMFGYGFKIDGMGKESKYHQRDLVLNMDRIFATSLSTKGIVGMTRMMQVKYKVFWDTMTLTSFYPGQDLPPFICSRRGILVIFGLETSLVHAPTQVQETGVILQVFCKGSLTGSRCMAPKCSLRSDTGPGEASSV